MFLSIIIFTSRSETRIMPFPLAVIPAIIEAGKMILDRVIPDKAAAEKAKMDLELLAVTQDFQSQMAQIATNIEEAKHPSLFVAGWRPMVGWTCAMGLFYQFIGYNMLSWLLVVAESPLKPPALETEGLLGLTLSMLGVAGMRSWEKWKGVARAS